jgi:hypothetical protein
MDSVAFSVYSKPIAGFTMCSDNTQCFRNNSFCFTNAAARNSLQPSNPLDTIFIDFGDAFYDSFSPGFTTGYHSFGFTGNFIPMMRVYDSLGCFSDFSLNTVLHVKPNIRPSFEWTGNVNCFGSAYRFENTTQVNLNELQSYTWNFGDNTSYTATAPFTAAELIAYDSLTHVYNGSGVFSPSLIINDTTGCTDTVNYTSETAQVPLPANIYFGNNITASSAPNGVAAKDTFCTGSTGANIYLHQPPIFGLYDGSGDYEWNFNDPYSFPVTDQGSLNPQHLYTVPGTYMVSLAIHNGIPKCDTVMYDTLYIGGPLARIEHPAAGSIIAPSHKYQAGSEDTVDFVNNSDHFGTSGGIKRTWDFDDDFAPVCTSYSIPNPGASLPFISAKDQYDNSVHFYIINNTSIPGKMNCRWSMDSLPRHKYTSWDSVYSWYVNGKTFPGLWGLPAISPNKPLTISVATPVPDPFWQAQGRLLQLTSGTLNNATDSIQYTIPGYGSFTRYANQTLPNSTLTFHEYVFRYVVSDCYNVNLTLTDTVLPDHCTSSATVAISHGKPDAHGLGISGKLCSGRGSSGHVEFNLGAIGNNAGTKPGCGQTFVLLNLDSLADRYDNTPCALDGFTDYQGGATPGGIFRPPFFSGPDFNPTTIWQDGSRSSLIYHYGPNSGTPYPADTLSGLITIGLVIGTGCANPPFCTQPVLVSDTIWYHDILSIKQPYAMFEFPDENELHAAFEEITFTIEDAFHDSVAYDMWHWGDNSITVDSFRYAGYDITNGFYHHGIRRVRYNFSINDDVLTLTDSLPFPLGLPRTPGKFSIVQDHLYDACTSGPNANPSWFIRDSALMLSPMKHVFTQTSEEVSGLEELMTTSVLHQVSTTAGCVSITMKNITIGVIDSFRILNPDNQPDTVFCAGESVLFRDFIRYFRFDNQRTSLPFNPGRSRNVVYLDPPYDSYQYDTINFWANDAHNPANISSIAFNPLTNRNDTFYTEKLYWNFGDGSPVYQGINPSHLYNATGRFKVEMISRDSIGHYDTSAAYLNIVKIVAKISIPDSVIMCGEFASFIDSSYIIGDSTLDLQYSNKWYFDAANDSTLWQSANNKSPKWYYENNGIFRIKLVTASYQGCESVAYSSIKKTGPRPKFTIISASNGCAPFTVRIVNTSDAGNEYMPNDTPTASLNVFWGDGSQVVSTQHRDTLEHTYTNGGQFSIYAYGSDALPGNPPICDPLLYPDTVNGLPPVYIKVNSIGEITGTDSLQTGNLAVYTVPYTDGAVYEWTVEGGTIQTVNGTNTIQILWPATAGIYRVMVTKALSGVSCVAKDTLMVDVFTGMNEAIALSNIKLYPNPVKSDLSISLNSLKTQDVQVRIYDILGKLCMSDTIHANSGYLTRTYSLAHLYKGVYLVELSTNDGKKVSKLLVE